MPVCPNCKYEYVDGIVICPDCNTPLVDSAELKKYPELSEEDWALVFTSFSEIEADMLKGNLESAGINSSVLSQKDSSFPAPGNLSVVKLFVKKADVAAALEFIQKFKSDLPDSQEDASQ
jgi:hypothetical protein